MIVVVASGRMHSELVYDLSRYSVFTTPEELVAYFDMDYVQMWCRADEPVQCTGGALAALLSSEAAASAAVQPRLSPAPPLPPRPSSPLPLPALRLSS